MSDRRICIQYPMPLDASANIIAALGAMYPDATICTDDPRSHKAMVIDLGTRTARSNKRRVGAQMIEPEVDAEVSGFSDGTLGVTTPREAVEALAEWARIALTGMDAANYIEQAATLPADGGHPERTLLVTACWSRGRTPHALRQAAEKRADAAEAELARLRAEAD